MKNQSLAKARSRKECFTRRHEESISREGAKAQRNIPHTKTRKDQSLAKVQRINLSQRREEIYPCGASISS
jgi:hypothetical protein